MFFDLFSGWRNTLGVSECDLETCRPNHIRGSQSIPCCSKQCSKKHRSLTCSRPSEPWWGSHSALILISLQVKYLTHITDLFCCFFPVNHCEQLFRKYQWLHAAERWTARALHLCTEGGGIWGGGCKWRSRQGKKRLPCEDFWKQFVTIICVNQ